MSALLDGGLQGVFGAVFGAIYLDGSLIRVTLTDDGEGGWSESSVAHPVKGQVDAVTERMRQSAGYTDGDMRIILLQSGIGIDPVTDDKAVLGGRVWSLADTESDPANTHWVMRGSLSELPIPTITVEAFTNDPTPQVSGTAIGCATVEIDYGGMIPVTATAAANGTWSTDLPALSSGTYQVRARQTLHSVTSGWSAAKTMVVDTIAPSIPVITTASPFITADTTPVIAGTMASDAVTVTVYLDGEEAGDAVLESGTWTYQFDEMPGGTYSITATATDAAGNVSDASTSLTLFIDLVAPAIPVITTPSPLVTSDTTPSITGTAEALSTVTVYLDGVAIGSPVAADEAGIWTFTLPAQSDGSYAVTATATDAVGNTSGYSLPLSMTVDNIAPDAPIITTGSPLVTNDTTPTISGTAEANATIIVYLDGVEDGEASADGVGSWAFTFDALADASYAVTALARDDAGNVSVLSNALALTIDTVDPNAPIITTTNPFVTTDTTPSIAGTAEANAMIIVYLDGVASGAPVTSDGFGAWAFTFAELAVDTYSVTATATDAAGNVSPASAALTLTVNAALAIDGTPVTEAVQGMAYDGFTVSVPANSGVPPFTYSIASGTLPTGITLDSVTGEVSGAPTEAGTLSDIIIQVEDSE